MANFDTLLIALFVPKAKPLDNFEIENSALTLLNRLFEIKKCVLYIFGNPYVLQILPNIQQAKEIIIAYQDFEVFQEVAAKKLIKNSEYTGVLPVLIPGINQ